MRVMRVMRACVVSCCDLNSAVFVAEFGRILVVRVSVSAWQLLLASWSLLVCVSWFLLFFVLFLSLILLRLCMLHILVRFVSAACTCLAGTSTESVCPIVTQNVRIRALDILCPIVICRDLFLPSWPAF